MARRGEAIIDNDPEFDREVKAEKAAKETKEAPEKPEKELNPSPAREAKEPAGDDFAAARKAGEASAAEAADSAAEAAERAAAPAAEPKKKSALETWYEGTPLGKFTTAVKSDIDAYKAAHPTATDAEAQAATGASTTDNTDDTEPRGHGRDREAGEPPEGATPAKPAEGGAVVPATGASTTTIQGEAGTTNGGTDNYYKGVNESMGANASEYLQKSQEAAEKLAAKQADVSALGAARNALSTAKTAGLNAGQAALSSGQTAAETYGTTYGTALGQGMDRYQGATGQFGTLAGQRAGEALTARGQDIAAKTASSQLAAQTAATQAQQQQSNTMGWLGFGASVLGALLSDENAKKNIEPTTAPDVSSVLAKLKATNSPKTTVEQVLAKVRPVKFDYKGEEDGSKRVGIIAQDLEKTPLKEAVVDTPEGKVIDTPQLTGGNTAMILELAQMLIDTRKELQSLKGAK